MTRRSLAQGQNAGKERANTQEISLFRVLGLWSLGFKEAFDAGKSRLAFVPPSQVPTTSDGAHSRKENIK